MKGDDYDFDYEAMEDITYPSIYVQTLYGVEKIDISYQNPIGCWQRSKHSLLNNISHKF